MAREGFTAHPNLFEGKANIFETYGGKDVVPLEEAAAHLGKPWEMQDPGIYVKRWACCYCNHRAVGGMLEMIAKHDIKPEEVTEIAIGFLPGSDTALVHHAAHTGLEGKFSIEYVAAATMLDRKLTLETFTDAVVQRPAVQALMKKCRRYRIDAPGVYSGVIGYTDVTIDTARGRFHERLDRAPGSPAWPMTPQDRVEKFMDCAGRILGEPGARRVLGLLSRFAALPDVRELVRSTVPSQAVSQRAATVS